MNEKADTWRQAHDRLMEENLALKQQLAAVRGAQHHMEACRVLLNVPDDEVLYGAIEELKQQLAAEREKVGTVQELVLKRDADIACLKAQLTSVDTGLFGELKPKGYEPDRALVVEQLQKQLATEREKVEAHRFVSARNRELSELLCDERESRKELERQLAAEREKFEAAIRKTADEEPVETLADLQDAMAQIEQLRARLADSDQQYVERVAQLEVAWEQLAAEREKCKEITYRILDLEHRLAAERERHGDEMTAVQLQLNKQLTAEKKKTESL